MKKIGILLGAVFFIGVQAFANFTGSFHIDPEVMHKKAIHGQMTLLMEEVVLTDAALKSVHLDLDEPVFGKTSFDSKEQAIRFFENGTLNQMTFVFQLNGARHKWYFVVVSDFQTTELATSSYVGSIYKVDAALEDILVFVENGVDTVPETWKKVGTTELAQ